MSGSLGTVHRINLSTGAITDIHYNRASDEGGAWDVAIGSNQIALLTTISNTGGFTPLHQIDLSTNAISVRNDAPGYIGSLITSQTQIERSTDRNRLYFLQWFIGPGPIFTYDATTNIFSSSAATHAILEAGAVNRNGTLLGTGLYNSGASLDTSAGFGYQRGFAGIDGGVAFDTQTDTLYGVNSGKKQIIAFDTNTFAEVFYLSFPDSIQFSQFGEGTLVASPDGIHLALTTASGIRLFNVTMGTAPAPPVFGTPQDMVFDHAGHYLYVTTKEGFIWPYNLSTNAFEAPYNIGGSLNAIDIAGDDSFLLVAQGEAGLIEGMFQKVSLGSGAVTNIKYTRDSLGESGACDVAIASNGIALGTTDFNGSGDTPVHQIDLATNTITNRTDAPGSSFFYPGFVSAPTWIHRSADGSRILFQEDNISSGPEFTYDAITNTFGPSVRAQQFWAGGGAAVNRNGTLVANGLLASGSVSLDIVPDFNSIHTFATLDDGMAFDAVHDTLYGINASTDQVVAFDTNSFAEKFRFNVGQNLPPSGNAFDRLVASHDGHYLALRTETAVRTFVVPPAPLVSVVSSMSQGSSNFSIDLPLDGAPSVECRSGGSNGDYTMVVTFSTAVTFGSASLTAGSGMVTSTEGSGSPIATILLTNVSNAQTVNVSLPGVSTGDSTTNLVIPMSILIGDTTGNGVVTASDVSLTKLRSGQPVTSSNFREDVNASGAINATDVSLVKLHSGSGLPSLAAPLARP